MYLPVPGAVLGAVLSRPLSRLVSFHLLLPLLSLLGCSSWLVVALVPSAPAVVTGRFLSGLFLKCLSCLCPIYIAAMAPTNYKISLLCAFSIIRHFGQIVVVALGDFLSWRVITLTFGIVPPIIITLSMFLLPLPEDTVTEKRERNISTIKIPKPSQVIQDLPRAKQVINEKIIIPKTKQITNKVEELRKKKEEMKKRYEATSSKEKKQKVVQGTQQLMFLGKEIKY